MAYSTSGKQRAPDLAKIEAGRFEVSPGAMEGLQGSAITAIHLPPGRDGFTRALLDRFANLSVIDVDAILKQVRSTVDQVSTVVEAVFLVALLEA
jgi:putative ABC transport system permease protein